MRAVLPALLSLLLAACLAAPDRAAEPAQEITVTALGDALSAAPAAPAAADEAAPPAAVEASAPLEDSETAAAAVPEPAEVTAGTQAGPPPVPLALTAGARACAARGGTLRPRAGGLWACIRTTRDGGRTCATATACEGECLARSRTCAPFEPLFGCHEVLDQAGRPQTLCRE
jgi:hypothetical protein